MYRTVITVFVLMIITSVCTFECNAASGVAESPVLIATAKPEKPALRADVVTQLPDGAEEVYIEKIRIQYDLSIEDTLKKRAIKKLIKKNTDSLFSVTRMKQFAEEMERTCFKNREVSVFVPQQSFLSGVMYISVVRKDNIGSNA